MRNAKKQVTLTFLNVPGGQFTYWWKRRTCLKRECMVALTVSIQSYQNANKVHI